MKSAKVSNDGKAVHRAAQVLCEGGVVMHATETCYGFAADIFNRAALQKVYELKRMSLDKPVSIMVRSLEEAKQYGDFGRVVEGRDPLALQLAERFWPGPLTLVIPRKNAQPQSDGSFLPGEGLAPFLNEGAETVGIRYPDFPLALELLEAFDGPLCTTSANISGLPQVYRVEDFLDQVRQQTVSGQQEDLLPDMVLDSGNIPFQLPSTVLQIMPGKSVEFLRKGELKNEIQKFLGT